MTDIHVAVVGYGNVGRSALAAVTASSDMQVAGLVRRTTERPDDLPRDVSVVTDVGDLPRADAAVLAVPTRRVPGYAERYVRRGIDVVDSFDLHGDDMFRYLCDLDAAARDGGARAMIGAGWDPGVDSVVRMLMRVLAARGLTYTNFGPGISLGHSAACRNIPGVRDAVSYTIPVGSGVHRREVYVELEPDADLSAVRRQIRADPYFSRDDTAVRAVDSVQEMTDLGHGGSIERRGSSADAHNTTVQFGLRGTNPAVTAEVMICGLRAVRRMSPGAYTLVDTPPVHLLPGDRESLIRQLV